MQTLEAVVHLFNILMSHYCSLIESQPSITDNTIVQVCPYITCLKIEFFFFLFLSFFFDEQGLQAEKQVKNTLESKTAGTHGICLN